MSEITEQLTQSSVRPLRKIVASKGDLQGNFYFAADAKLSDAGLAVTLSTRDPKGAKVAASGKKLRKEIRGARFGRGLLSARGSRLVFELHSGSAPVDLLRKALKTRLCEADGLGFLRKSIVTTPGAEPTEADDDSSDEVVTADEAVVLSAEEQAELEAVVRTQGDLKALNGRLKESFLSAQAAEREQGQLVVEQLSQIQELERGSGDDAALAEARDALAALIYTGRDPLPPPGQRLSPQVLQVLKASIASAEQSIGALFWDAMRTISDLRSSSESDDLSGDALSGAYREALTQQRAAGSYIGQLEKYLR